MAAFFPDLLDVFVTPAFLEGVREKFHYGIEQAEGLRAVAEEMQPLMRREAFWERKESVGGRTGVRYEDVVMSLGSGADNLQESYNRDGRLSESYMLEALAGELLLWGYGAYNRYVQANTDWHVAGYHFPGSGDGFPLEMLPQMLKGFAARITCNAAYCMSPKKSVAFVAELTKDEGIRCESICVGCGRMDCPNRTENRQGMGQAVYGMDLALNYGYRRIFGKWGER